MGDGLVIPDAAGVQRLSNAVRVLVRVLPFLFEDKSRNWFDTIFNIPPPSGEGDRTVAQQFASAALHLLFVPNYTLPASVSARKDGTYTTIWCVLPCGTDFSLTLLFIGRRESAPKRPLNRPMRWM